MIPSQQFSGIGMTSQRTRERLVQRLQERGIRNPRVLEALRSVPRHLFVDEALASRAYEDTALPIGCGQTISQPYVVARMTEALLECAPQKVLEVGTGCGYQTAILASLGLEVYSIERIGSLYERARSNLSQIKLSHVRLRHGDGYAGWKGQAPFDAILVAAAPPEVPEALKQQLVDGGCLILPVGGEGAQRLLRITRQGEHYQEQVLDRVSFVPMLNGAQR
ncbi:MAG: protein-L-isoaspartate(D-aspartate) O-methyltransferase [Pseudomonadota bacterium]